MTGATDELTQDYLDRLARVQPSNLPDDLDLFYEETASRGIRLNKAAYSLKHAAQRELFASDEEAWMDQFGLTGQEKDLMRRRDWIGLWRGGGGVLAVGKPSGGAGAPPAPGRQEEGGEGRWAKRFGGSGGPPAPPRGPAP